MNDVQLAFATMIVAAYSTSPVASLLGTSMVLSVHGEIDRYFTPIRVGENDARTVRSFCIVCLIVTFCVKTVFILTG